MRRDAEGGKPDQIWISLPVLTSILASTGSVGISLGISGVILNALRDPEPLHDAVVQHSSAAEGNDQDS